jgi:hypothetical protein
MGKHVHNHRQAKPAKTDWVAIDPTAVPTTSQNALREAMAIEGVPLTQFKDLLWLMAQESGGMVDLRNGRLPARGMFQLLRPQYELNPNGESSFGNAVEECQGGIRYLLGRYHTAASARLVWEAKRWC